MVPKIAQSFRTHGSSQRIANRDPKPSSEGAGRGGPSARANRSAWPTEQRLGSPATSGDEEDFAARGGLKFDMSRAELSIPVRFFDREKHMIEADFPGLQGQMDQNYIPATLKPII
jgi:hypothetical protein